MAKNKQYIDWSFGDGEVKGSYNVEALSKLSAKQISEQYPHFFPNYGEKAREIRIEALHGAIMEAKAASDKKAAAAEKTSDTGSTAKTGNK